MAKKNELCECGKGLPYKYCCIANELRDQNLFVDLDRKNRIYALVDMTKDILNINSSIELPLKYFCKDYDFYFFSMAVRLSDQEFLHERLRNKSLTIQQVFDVFSQNCTLEGTMALLETACTETEFFSKRKHILEDGFKLHFEGRYTSSIPTLIPQLEGILREYGKIENSKNVVPVIPRKIWQEEGLYSVEDDAKNYNHFISKLFEGNKDADIFNRNPILHGFKIDYNSREHSLTILLAIMEIRLFIWWQKKCLNFKDTVRDGIFKTTQGNFEDYFGHHKVFGQDLHIFQFPR